MVAENIMIMTDIQAISISKDFLSTNDLGSCPPADTTARLHVLACVLEVSMKISPEYYERLQYTSFPSNQGGILNTYMNMISTIFSAVGNEVQSEL